MAPHPHPHPRKFLRLQLLGLGVTLTLSERWRKSSAGDGVGETTKTEHFREPKTTSRFPGFQGVAKDREFKGDKSRWPNSAQHTLLHLRRARFTLSGRSRL